jgi:uncharacterized protein (TIGR03437 family)
VSAELSRRSSWAIVKTGSCQWFPALLLFAVTAGGQPVPGKVPQSPLELQITTNDTPPGGMAQIRIGPTTPIPIASGGLTVDLDPIVFGPIFAVDVFSATGDQMGYSSVKDRRVEVQLYSITGGIGRLPSMPMVVITVPVLASAAAGRTGKISVSSTSGPWKDVDGNQYLPGDSMGRMKAGGTMAINAVTPGGGLLAAGTTVRVDGLGFTPSSSVEIDGAVVRSAQLTGPQSFQLILGGSADLTGKRVLVRNPDGTRAEFYCALRGRIQDFAIQGSYVPIFPLSTFVGAYGWPMVQNPNTKPVDVNYREISARGINQITLRSIVTLQPGEIRIIPPTIIGIGNTIGVSLSTSDPVRMLDFTPPPANSSGLPAPVLTYGISSSFAIGWSGAKPSCSTEDPFHGLTSEPACVVWVSSSPAPKPISLSVVSQGAAAKFSAAIESEDGGNWVSISPTEGTTCTASSACTSTILAVRLEPELLEPGVYNATIKVTPDLPGISPQSLPLTLRVVTSLISVDGPSSLNFIASSDGSGTTPIDLQVSSPGDPVPFSAFIRNPQDWLTVSPSNGVTPAKVTVTAHPEALPGSITGALNYVTIGSQGNSVTRLVMLSKPNPRPSVLTTSLGADPITGWIKQGTVAPVTRFFSVSPYAADDVQSKADGAGLWLKAAVGKDANGSAAVVVSIDPTGLSAGVYHGTITARASTQSIYAPASVDVNLIIWSTPPAVSVSPQSLDFTVASGSLILDIYSTDAANPKLNVSSNGMPVEYKAEIATNDGNAWLSVATPTAPRYGVVYFGVDARNLPPGDYEGTVRITAPSGSSNTVTVPAHLKVTPALPRSLPPGPPLAVTVVNGASQSPGAVAPGEIVTIYGMNIGSQPNVFPAAIVPHVYFGGRPAPILFASPTQINTMVPFEVTASGALDLVLEFRGTTVAAGGLPVASSAPGIFAVSGSGVGQAYALNQDGTRNGADHPASQGSTVRLFVTGIGTHSGGPLSVTIGGVGAAVVDTLPASGAVDGLTQLLVIVPQRVQTGPAIPVQLQAGSAGSPAGVTLAIR